MPTLDVLVCGNFLVKSSDCNRTHHKIWTNAKMWMNVLSMHLTASNTIFVLIHMTAIRLVFKKRGFDQLFGLKILTLFWPARKLTFEQIYLKSVLSVIANLVSIVLEPNVLMLMNVRVIHVLTWMRYVIILMVLFTVTVKLVIRKKDPKSDCPDENHRQTLNFESLISQPNHQLYLAW